MKFGDKLIALRKKKGLSQEELAEKLGVSRQSVSKWESNNTYPETEKIIQICNLFDCSMDDLINDKITDIGEVERKEKNNINFTIDSFLDFTSKTVNLFSRMTFGSGIKCVIELCIIAGVLALGGGLIISIFKGLLNSLFQYASFMYNIADFISSLLYIVWFIIIIIIMTHIFKVRYLDYYDQFIKEQENNKESNNKEKSEEKINLNNDSNIKMTKKEKELIIRDSKHEPYAFLTILSKIIIFFAKFCVAMIEFAALGVFFSLMIFFVILIPFAFTSMVFTGISIATVSAIIINLLIIVYLFNFLFNKKTAYKLLIITLIACVAICGVGTGVGILGLKNIEFQKVDKEELNEYTETIYFDNNMYIEHGPYDVKYKVDNNLPKDQINIKALYNKNISYINSYWETEDNMRGYQLDTYSNVDFKKIYETVLKDLKNNIIKDYDGSISNEIEVVASQETIDKLIDNLGKIYLFDKVKTDDGFKTENYEYKVHYTNEDYCRVEYDAIKDSMVVKSKECKCTRQNIETSKGTKILYDCYYDEEIEEE